MGVAAAALAALAGLAAPVGAQVVVVPAVPLEGPVAWPEPTNAAPIYWRAFYEFTTLRQSTPELKEIDFSAMLAEDDASGYGLSDEEVENLGRVRGVIEMALRASRVEACNWEVDYDLGIQALLPHLGPMRNLARLFSADIRRCVQEGDIQGGLDRLVALHAFARAVRGDGILISSLVSCAIANLACTQTSLFLAHAELTAEQRATLVGAIDAYGAADPFAVRQAVTNEGVWLTAWLAEQVRGGEFRAEIDMLFDLGDGSNAEQVERVKRLSDAEIMENLGQCRQYYADAVALWGLADAGDRLEVLGTLVEEGHYGTIARVMAAALSKSYMADARGQGVLEASRGEVLSDELAATPVSERAAPAGRAR